MNCSFVHADYSNITAAISIIANITSKISIKHIILSFSSCHVEYVLTMGMHAFRYLQLVVLLVVDADILAPVHL